MHKIRNTIATLLFMVAFGAMAVDAVQPQTLSGATLVRGATSVITTTNTLFVSGATILFTNCVTYSDTGSTTQGLSSVTVQVGVGSYSSSIWYTATVTDAANGKFTCTAAIPASQDFTLWQVKLTDVNTNIYYYPAQRLNLISHL
jgi:hypothetical protein